MASARFTFIGTLDAKTDESSSGYFLREGKTSNGNPYASINLQVVQEKNNRGFVECFGAESKTVKTLNNDMNKYEIDWNSRFDEDVVKEVPNFKKTIVKIGDDKKEFIASYDAVKYIADHIDEFKGKTVIVSGQRKKNAYKGKITDRFEFSSIRTVADDEEVKNRLTVNMELMFNKESIDLNDWKEEKKIIINGWTSEYMSDVKEDRYVNQQVILDCSKIDFENERHVKQLKFKLKMVGCELDDNNKVVVKLKTKKIYMVGITSTFINGQEQLEFTDDMLTDIQKEALELGLKTLDDFRPSGSVYGQRVQIYKLRDFDMRAEGKYAEGYIEVELTQDEFDEKYYEVVDDSEGESAIEEKPESNDDDGDDEDDLFG